MAEKEINNEASTAAAAIMNMMIICSLAAWWTEDPPMIAPVIVPGIATIPMTLWIEEIPSEREEEKLKPDENLTSCW